VKGSIKEFSRALPFSRFMSYISYEIRRMSALSILERRSTMVKGWKSIAEDIARRIGDGELAPGHRLAPGEEIATQWGVSRHTAHRAIEELQRQGLVIRQRRWGTVVAGPASRATGRVALMVDRFAPAVNFPPAEMLRGMQDGLGEDAQLVVIDSRSDPEVEARRLANLSGEVDGLIIVPTADPRNTARLQRIVDAGLPLVVLDRVPEGLRSDAVVSDNEAATLDALHALEARGHRRIGFFSFNKPDFSSVRERHAAYVAALAEVGLRDHIPYERWFARELDGDSPRLFQAVQDALFALTNGPEPITALFCVQDVFAAAALEAGIQLGHEIPLATFNDWPTVMLRTPPTTLRIVQRTHDIGLTAAKLLLDRIHGARPEPRLVRVAAELIVPGPERPQAPVPFFRPTEVAPQ
jgi:GntR family transcriptional regulator of arabinose operon